MINDSVELIISTLSTRTWDRGLVGFVGYLSDKRKRVAAASDRARLIVHVGMNNQLATFIRLWTYTYSQVAELS